MGTLQVNSIPPSDTHPPNIWARDMEELYYEIAHLIETPYSGGVGYWSGVGVFTDDVTSGDW